MRLRRGQRKPQRFRRCAWQRFGIEEFVGANDNLIAGNDVAGNRQGGVLVTGVTTTVTANAGSIVGP